MFRLLVYLALGYMIWKIVQIVARNMSSSRHNDEDVFANQSPKKPPQMFKDVKDADFEELPPDDKK